MNTNEPVSKIPNGKAMDNEGNTYVIDNGVAYRVNDNLTGVNSEESVTTRKPKKIYNSSGDIPIFDDVRVKSERKYTQPTGQRVTEHIVGRLGQTKFRKELLEKYNEKCVVTGCDVVDVLEAAHIYPYADGGDPTVQNGLLLRSDIHTLFDLDLLGINPDGFIVELNPVCDHEPYSNYRSTKLPLSDVDCNAIKERYKLFQKRLL